jgi:cytochrome c
MIKNFISNFISQNKPALKIAGSGFAIALLVLGVSVLLADLLYQPKKMVKRGFEVEVQLATENVGGVKTGNLPNTKTAAAKKPAADIASLIASADIDAGAKVFKKCATCHTAVQGGGNKVGPNLFGVVGRKRASIAGFAYSEAMKAKGGSWTVEDLNLWLTKPRDFVPGTKMGFAGLPKDKDRANVIAYLKQQK